MTANQPIDQAGKERAKDLFKQGRLEDARGVLSELCVGDQRDMEIWTLYIAANGYLGRFEDVVSACQKVLEIEIDYLPALTSLASALAALKRYDEAAVKFMTLLQLAPDNPAILNNYGHTLFLMGRLAQAQRT